ncbi:MAG: DinB family protein [Chloroflexota bacterium]
MAQKLVEHLWFAREKWLTGYDGLSNKDAIKRHGDANCPSWMVGHLACFEQLTWCQLAQGKTVVAELKQYDFGEPATTPPLDEVMTAWKAVMPVCDEYLKTLTEADMTTHLKWPNGRPFWDDIGTTILRHTWHYWYHLGEMQALRSGLGHKNLGPYIGNMSGYGQYQ